MPNLNLKAKLLKIWRRKAIGAGGIAFLGLGCWLLPFTQWFTHFSYDLPFALRSEIRPQQALIVFMDDESRSRLRQSVQGPWDRALHIQLMNTLSACHAAVVVFDLLFDEAWPQKSVDDQLAAAMRSHGRVVLGASCRYSEAAEGLVVGNFRRAVEPLAAAAATSYGIVELPFDTDGAIRRHCFSQQYTNLSREVAALLGVSSADQTRPKWINYYGSPGAIPHVSYYQVLEPGAIPLEAISNKVVFVGTAPIITYQGSHSTDEFRTSYSRWTGASCPGVEIQATACLNLLRRDWLARLPWPVEGGLLLTAAVLLGFLLPVFRPGIALLVGLGCSLGVAVAALILAWQFHLWFCWAGVALLEVPAALGWLALGVFGQPTAVPTPMPNPEITSPEPPPEGPPRIPDHELLRRFGQGSYGEVWLARTVLGSYRAVKIVFRKAFETEAPFDRELRGIQAFEPISRSHEGFVDILQVGQREDAGYFYYVMELADDQEAGGQINPEQYVPKTLSNELARRQRLPCDECVHLGILLSGALQQLHRLGLIHRDIKPSNIIFVAGIPKLADVGLVVETAEAKSFVGTEGFVPPEGPGSPQADIYSLGKVLYEISMGRDRARFPELPTNLAEDPEQQPLLALNGILLKACHRTASRRYQTAEKMQTDLKRLANRLKNARNKEAV